MKKKLNILSSILIFTMLVFLVYPSFSLPARAEEITEPEEYHLPGTIEGTGTFFQVTDSSYLNVTLTSSEGIYVYLESMPNMVNYHIKSTASATSTIIILSDFVPNKNYFLYQDGNLVSEFITNDEGIYSYTQDLSVPHHVFIQEYQSTVYIKADGSVTPSTAPISRNGDTYTLTGNIYDSLYIQKSGITLDGAGYTVQGTGSGYGIYQYNKSGNTIKNLVVDHFSRGIYILSEADWSTNNTITGNTLLSNTYDGIVLYNQNSNSVITNNTVTGSSFGINLFFQADYNTVSNNTVTGGNTGIYIYYSKKNIISDNIVSRAFTNIQLFSSNYNTLINNTFFIPVYYGVILNRSAYNLVIQNTIMNARLESYRSSNNTLYSNNIINSSFSETLGTNIWNNGLGEGNYWSDYTGQDLNGDGVGDTNLPHKGVDWYPLMFPWPPNTPIGNNVQITPCPDVTVTFSQVTQAGYTTAVVTTTQPAPDKRGFKFLGTYYDINTTATYVPPVTACLHYDDTGLKPNQEKNLKIFHWDGSVWIDATSSLDTVNNIICGMASSLSWFGIGYDNTPPVTTVEVSGTKGNNDWFVSDVNATLTATDNEEGSGIAETKYSFDNGQWNTYANPVTVSTEGTNYFYYYSTDNVGNIEEIQSTMFMIDKTPPNIALVSPQPYGLYQIGMALEFSATDEGSGLKTLEGILTNATGEILTVQSGYVPPPGVYSLIINATDNAGNTSQSQAIPFVVYDPEGGFGTGGGWFYPDSESSLNSDSKATFGFVAKYKQGVSAGNLEFQYHGTDGLNLKSTTIDWLVISDTSAQFQGTGTINGQGLYTFRVQAKDFAEPGLGADHFDIRIWQGSDTSVNPLHKAKNTLSGGNIVVHKK